MVHAKEGEHDRTSFAALAEASRKPPQVRARLAGGSLSLAVGVGGGPHVWFSYSLGSSCAPQGSHLKTSNLRPCVVSTCGMPQDIITEMQTTRVLDALHRLTVCHVPNVFLAVANTLPSSGHSAMWCTTVF